MCRVKPEARGFTEYKDLLQIIFPLIYLAGITEKTGCIMNAANVKCDSCEKWRRQQKTRGDNQTHYNLQTHTKNKA